MKVASIVEMLNVPPPATGPASLVQVSGQPPQTFKESLLAASKTSSGTGVANEGGAGAGRRQKSVSEDAKLPPTAPHIRAVLSPFPSQQELRPQIPVAQQPPLIKPAFIPMQPLLEGPAVSTNTLSVAAAQPTRDFAAIRFSPVETNNSHSTVAKSDAVPSSHAQTDGKAPQAVSISSFVAYVSQTTTNVSNAIADVAVSNHLSNAVLNANTGVVANVIPSVLPDVIQTVVPSAIQSAAPVAVPITVTSVESGALPSAVLKPVPIAGSGVVSRPVPSVASANPSPVASANPSPVASAVPGPVATVVPGPVASAVPSPVATVVPGSVVSVVSSLIPNVVPAAVSTVVRRPLPNTSPSVVPFTLAKAVAGTVTKSVTGAIPGAVQDSISPLVPNPKPDASLSDAPVPASHSAASASAKGQVASKSNPASTSQAEPAVAPDPSGLATGLSTLGTTADQSVALIQPGGGLFVTAQGGTSGAIPSVVAKPSDTNGNDGASNAANDSTGLKPHAQSAPGQPPSGTQSQEAGSSGDQSQGGAAQQGQSVAPVQMSFANHAFAAVDHTQNVGVAAPLQSAPVLAGASGHVAKTSDTPATPAIALPQAVPVINTAKLIQSLGQSEMRVGMHSNDFGNISISTSATRDLISAQISVDHGELARTLAVHLPEMQARLGGSQAMDVRIDMNGQATGQGMGTSAGMANGNADGSRGDRQQKGNVPSSQSDGIAGQGNSIAAGVLPSGESRLDDRLDIRA